MAVATTFSHVLPSMTVMRYAITFERETDGRWIAEIVDLPGVLAYGETQTQALAKVQALALRVISERIDAGEIPAAPLDISFAVA